MIKRYVLPALFFIVMFGGAGAIYQFYFKNQLAEYGENLARRDRLHSRIKELEEKFDRTVPEDVVRNTRRQIQPLKDAVEKRAEFFRMPRPAEETPLPEDGIWRFVYRDLYEEKFRKLQQFAWDHVPRGYIAQSISFGVNPPDAGRIEKDEVRDRIDLLDTRMGFARELLDAGILEIYDIRFWSPRSYGDILEMQTIGVQVRTTFPALAKFFDQLRTQDMFVTVDALEMHLAQSPRGIDYSPYIDVSMLLTMARKADVATTAGGVGGAAETPQSLGDLFAGFNLGGSREEAEAEAEEEPGFFGKAWKLFKRYVLYMN